MTEQDIYPTACYIVILEGESSCKISESATQEVVMIPGISFEWWILIGGSIWDDNLLYLSPNLLSPTEIGAEMRNLTL